MRLTILTLLLLATTCFADSIQLPTTGQSASGTQRDANYTITIQSTNARTTVSSAAQAYIATTYDPKWAVAPWITPSADGKADMPGGLYTYTTTFPLPAGVNAITGSLFVDDRVAIYFNGKPITELPTDSESGYWTYTPSHFSITSGFFLGTNTLEFRVINTHHNTPVGLAVTALSATTAAPVPEPATLTLLGAGLAGLAAALRRKRTQGRCDL